MSTEEILEKIKEAEELRKQHGATVMIRLAFDQLIATYEISYHLSKLTSLDDKKRGKNESKIKQDH